jgi:3alpha(or 20beta)-hydroxysteroid dehydrogenase
VGLLEGKVAIITGGASGQGAAEARLFAAEGASVVIGDRQDDLGLKLADEIGESALFVHLDVSDEGSWDDAIRRAIDRFGEPTVLIQSAAIVHHKLIEDSSRVEFDRVLAINLVGPYLGMQAVLPSMRLAGGGVIVNVGSAASLTGVGGRALYGASKWGLRGLTRSAAVEFGYYNVRVNSIQPGAIDTPMLRQSDQYLPPPQIPVARYGTADEVAQAALFLASDQSAYITGAEIAVDGGAAAGYWVQPRDLLKA